jgi:hypothetical protein
MGVYSFQDVACAINGPGGSFSLSGSGVAEEGISIAMTDDKGSMMVGADGEIMHSLHAGKSGTVTVRLLKTSPANQLLAQMYNTQTTSSAYHGRNTISVRDPIRGDSITARECGFRKLPDIGYNKDGATQEWVFLAGKIDTILGNGNPTL